jgi:heat shock protein HslJ
MMRKIPLKMSALAAVFLLNGCFTPYVAIKEAELTEQTWWISPVKIACDTVGGQCFNSKEITVQGTMPWLAVTGQISGFTYEPGMFYKIKIAQDPEIEPPSKQYQLTQMLQKKSQYFLPNTMLTDGRKWHLKSLAPVPDKTISALENPPYLMLSELGLNGFSGCNRMMGKPQYLFEATDYQQSMIKFGPIAMTRMACRQPLANSVEHQMTLILNQVDQFAVAWPWLNLYRDDQLIAQFVAQDWD